MRRTGDAGTGGGKRGENEKRAREGGGTVHGVERRTKVRGRERERARSGRASEPANGDQKGGRKKGERPYSRARETERENPVAWRRAI